MAFQQTVILGNLGRDPELKYLANGRAVCSFSVAVNETWTDKNSQERKEKTNWYRVSVWGPQGEMCANYLSKGRQVLIVGTVEARAYLDQSGQPQATLELTAREVRFVGGRNDNQGGGGNNGAGGSYEEYGAPTDANDIPF